MVTETLPATSSSLLPSLSIHLRINNNDNKSNDDQVNLNYSSTILVIGAGTWGASTALHLARRGYTNVRVFDAYPQPSAISAGNDVNKIVNFSEYQNCRKL